MAGAVEWQFVLFIGGFAVAEAAFVWWLAEQFRKNRHSMNNALFPIVSELDDLKERIIRLEVLVLKNGKH